MRPYLADQLRLINPPARITNSLGGRKTESTRGRVLRRAAKALPWKIIVFKAITPADGVARLRGAGCDLCGVLVIINGAEVDTAIKKYDDYK